MRTYPVIHPWMVHLYWIGGASFTSAAGIFHASIFGTVTLCAPLLALSQKKLCATGAEFFTTIVSPTRATVTRLTNMQHGWSIITSAALRLASSGKILSLGNSDFGSVSSGRRNTTTFLMPLLL